MIELDEYGFKESDNKYIKFAENFVTSTLDESRFRFYASFHNWSCDRSVIEVEWMTKYINFKNTNEYFVKMCIKGPISTITETTLETYLGYYYTITQSSKNLDQSAEINGKSIRDLIKNKEYDVILNYIFGENYENVNKEQLVRSNYSKISGYSKSKLDLSDANVKNILKTQLNNIPKAGSDTAVDVTLKFLYFIFFSIKKSLRDYMKQIGSKYLDPKKGGNLDLDYIDNNKNSITIEPSYLSDFSEIKDKIAISTSKDVDDLLSMLLEDATKVGQKP